MEIRKLETQKEKKEEVIKEENKVNSENEQVTTTDRGGRAKAHPRASGGPAPLTGGPRSPGGPMMPSLPSTPGGPAGPAKPLGPSGPWGPCSPMGPGGPGWPVSPLGPFRPIFPRRPREPRKPCGDASISAEIFRNSGSGSAGHSCDRAVPIQLIY